jgi:predicted nucleic acid-binding Zn ribbon protein
MKCPACKKETSGKFCSNCGTPLSAAACPKCGASLVAGARFCTQCGHGVGRARSRTSSLPWFVAGAAVIVALFAIFLPTMRGDQPASAPVNAPFATGGGGSPPPLTGTPREQADRLFGRIMQERENGNLEQARFFAPMAIQAYQAAEPLDDDAYYHLSLIHTVAGDYAAARRTADQVLSQNPNHLLALAALAEALTGAGDTAGARAAWQRFLDNLETERAKPLAEYQAHAPVIDIYAQQARQAVGGS